MTQAELWQLHLLAVSNGITAFGVLLTLITGYLVTAYFAGSRLSRYQAAVVSALFLLGAGLGAFMVFVETRRAFFFIDQLQLEFNVQSFTPGTLTLYLMGLLLVLLIPAALFAGGKGVGMSDRTLFLLAVAGAAAGLSLPTAFLRSIARNRQEAITDALPDALDLLTVCVEAGLGINSAFLRIAEEFRLSSPTLSEEFDVVNREMVAGKPRMEALRALADRTGVEDVKSLVAMLIQTERLGTSLAQSLRVHSDSLRVRRRQRAEEAAAKTTIKLVFPLVFLLFPALFIVILGPGVLQILHVLFPSINAATGG